VAYRAYLLDWLYDLGPGYPGATGMVGLPHTEIRAWAKNIGLKLKGGEAEWLHKLSLAFVTEMHRSDGKDTEAPYTEEE